MKYVSSITWSESQWKYLTDEIGGIEDKTRQKVGREVNNHVRTLIQLISTGTLVLSHEGQTIGITTHQRERVLTAEEIKLKSGKKIRLSGAVPIFGADATGDLLKEVKEYFKKRPELRATLKEMREEQQTIAEAMKPPTPPEDIKPPPDPPTK